MKAQIVLTCGESEENPGKQHIAALVKLMGNYHKESQQDVEENVKSHVSTITPQGLSKP